MYMEVEFYVVIMAFLLNFSIVAKTYIRQRTLSVLELASVVSIFDVYTVVLMWYYWILYFHIFFVYFSCVN